MKVKYDERFLHDFSKNLRIFYNIVKLHWKKRMEKMHKDILYILYVHILQLVHIIYSIIYSAEINDSTNVENPAFHGQNIKLDWRF